MYNNPKLLRRVLEENGSKTRNMSISIREVTNLEISKFIKKIAFAIEI